MLCEYHTTDILLAILTIFIRVMKEFMYLLIRITVEEQINHDIPWHFTANTSTQTQYFTSQHPPHKTNGMIGL